MKIRPRRFSLATLVLAMAVMAAPTTAPFGQTFRPVVRGRRGAVASGHPLSSEAGLRLLYQGGNAVDAGCAAILAASVIEFSHFSFGGEVPIIIKLRNGAPAVINGQGIAPRLATRQFFLDRATRNAEDQSRPYSRAPEYVSIPGSKPGTIPSSGILPATVPGVLDAVVTALDRFGTKTLAEVMQPAIELADAFPIDEVRVRYIEMTSKILERWSTTARLFLPGGKVPRLGEIFSQPDLARTLRGIIEAERLARQKMRGPGGRHVGLVAARDFFYKGLPARRISEFCEANGGLLRAADLAAFHARVEEPVHDSYRGFEVYKAGFWSQGPVMIEALNILEGYDLRAMGHNSADYLHTVVEALKLALADRDRYYGDPDFARVPGSALISKGYAAVRKTLIDPSHASLERRSGDPVAGKPLSSDPPLQVQTGPSSVSEAERAHDTTCVNVIDKDGNLFSATPSGAWLPAVVAGDTGILLGQRLQSFVLTEGHPNVLEPGKRPRITLTPTLVLKDGKPYMVLSTPGGDNQDQALIQVLLNVLEFRMSVQEAVEAPRFETLHMMSSFDDHRFNPGILNLEDRISGDTVASLKALGHIVKLQRSWGTPSAPTVIVFRPESGVIEAGADPRGGRYALAW
jgi:gamma-glutamyltranspeptidase/glutathione hydrolase